MSTRSFTRSKSPGIATTLASGRCAHSRRRGPTLRSVRKLEERLQLSDVDRLRHVLIESGFARQTPVACLAVAGQGHEGRGKSELGAHPTRDLVAVESGHADIEQHDVRAVYRRLLDRAGT